MTITQPLQERVVLLLFRNSGVKRANTYTAYVTERGVQVDILVADGQGWRNALKLHPGARVYSIGRAENRLPLIWLYTTIIERGPAAVLRRLDGRVPGAHFARRAHRKIAGKLRKHVFWRIYRPLRHQAVRPLAVRRLDRLDLDGVSRVICVDESTIPLGWSIVKRYPDLEVTRKVDRHRYDDRPVLAPNPPWSGDRALDREAYATL
ncbi:hypothetical protein AB0B28_07380 [Glycomyces sp. NPDC046736]|uniref:hypothetical protein n=1 Tax=Glycomyces sp. NPDC046736 TaxID=3155615 RepID=UPI0033BFFB91